MKKIISIFIAVLLISCCLCMTVSARGNDFTVAEDFQSMTYHGVTYRRADLTMVSIDYYDYIQEQPQLTAGQQELLRGCSFCPDYSEQLIQAEFFFQDGSTLICGYVAEDFWQQFQDYLTDDETECYVEFYWDSLNQVTAEEYRFQGDPVTLKSRSLQNAESLPVYVNHGAKDFTIIKGTLMIIQDNFYYVDHQQIGLYQPYPIDLYEYESLECYEITDPELIADIEDAMGTYYDVTYASGNLLEIASFVFWTLIFAVIPAAILVLSVIFAIRGKGYYRLTWGATAGFAALSLIMYFVFISKLFLSA